MALCDTLDQVAPGSAIASRGFLLSYLGRLNQADSLFHSLLDSPDRYSSSSRAYSYLAWVAFRRQHYAQGLALMKPALEQQPETYNFWIAGLLAAGQRDTAFANRCLQAIAGEFGGARDDSAVTEAYGARRFFHHLRGTIAICAGRPAEAARMYEQALRYVGQGDGPFFRTAYGRALLESGQIGRSIQELGRVLAFNPNYPEALLYLGRAYAQAGQRAQARRVLEQLGVLWKGADRDDPLNQERLKLMSQVSSPSPGPHAVLPRARPGTGL